MSIPEVLLFLFIGALGGLVSNLAISIYNGKFSKWLSDRRARIEAQKQADHKRAMEKYEKNLELIALAFSAAQAAMAQAEKYRAEKRKQFEPGGTVAPNTDAPRPGRFGWEATATDVDRAAYVVATVNRKGVTPEEQKALRQAIRDANKKAQMTIPQLGELHMEDGKYYRVQYVDHATRSFSAESYGETVIGIWRDFSEFNKFTVPSDSSNEQPDKH